MLLRLAPSHVRFGHFEYFYYSNQHERLKELGGHVLAYVLALSADRIHDLVETASAFGSAGVFVTTLFALYTRIGGPNSAYAAMVAGMGVWLVARFGFGVTTPYLLALGCATLSYVAVAWLDRTRVATGQR